MKYPTQTHIMKTTSFKTQRLAKAALETLLWLEQGAPHKFDGLPGEYTFNMNYEHRTTKDCGTACCIGGAMLTFDKLSRGEKISYIDLADMYDYDGQLRDLFYPYDKDFEAITPQEGFIALYNYLTTGEVSWDHVKDAR